MSPLSHLITQRDIPIQAHKKKEELFHSGRDIGNGTRLSQLVKFLGGKQMCLILRCGRKDSPAGAIKWVHLAGKPSTRDGSGCQNRRETSGCSWGSLDGLPFSAHRQNFSTLVHNIGRQPALFPSLSVISVPPSH